MSTATAGYGRPPLPSSQAMPVTMSTYRKGRQGAERHVIPPSPRQITPVSDSAHGVAQMREYEPAVSPDSEITDDGDSVATKDQNPLMDLAQLEELHIEAERMKALGNKHMAAQGA